MATITKDQETEALARIAAGGADEELVGKSDDQLGQMVDAGTLTFALYRAVTARKSVLGRAAKGKEKKLPAFGRAYFTEHAEPFEIVTPWGPMFASPRQFGGKNGEPYGTIGWDARGNYQVKVGEHIVTVTVAFTAFIANSKALPQDS